MNRRTAPKTRQVVRRVGGLEVPAGFTWQSYVVVRRVGGLEGADTPHAATHYVVRRVGGLEVQKLFSGGGKGVVRRVGGLEGLIEESFIMGFPFLTRRRWNGRNGRSRNSPL